MRHGQEVLAGGVSAGLLSVLISVCAAAHVHAAQAEELVPEVPPPRSAELSEGPSPEDFVTLEVRESDLVLTNTSDRPIVAWTVRTVVRISEGNEGWSGTGEDRFRYSLLPEGEEGLLRPGESVVLQKGAEPWVREDLKGPDFGVYYDVGALVFENAEWTGVPEVVDRIFETRLELARKALQALEVTESAKAADGMTIEDLPRGYRRNLDSYASLHEAARAIHARAREDYRVAVANLRLEDLAQLNIEEKTP